MKEWVLRGRKIKLVNNNIALLDVQAIVNAANKSLILGSGVAGAIKKFGGPSIQDECDRIGPINVGEVALTRAGTLKAKYVIHAVGPVYGEGEEEKKLAMATRNSLSIANREKMKSIAFPAISTGIYGFPLKECSEIMLSVAKDFIKENEYPQEIIFCLFGEEAYTIFAQTLDKLKQNLS